MPDELIQPAAPAARDERPPPKEKPKKKYPSGAAKKKKAYEKAEAERTNSYGEEWLGDHWKLDDGKWAKDFEAAGKPDLQNPGMDLDYTRKLQLICLRQMATTPFPTRAQHEAWRRIKEMSATVGMTSNRAQLEAKVKRLSKQLATQTQSGTITEVSGKGFKKNPEARGGMTGPRSIESDTSDKPE